MVIRILESREFLLVESEILGFRIRNLVQGIRYPSNDLNPSSTGKKSGIQYRESGIQNSRLSWITLRGATKIETKQNSIGPLLSLKVY